MERIVSPELSQPMVTIPPSSSPTDPDAIPASQIDSTFAHTSLDLISSALGSSILSYSDEFFAPASNLINPASPISKPGVFVDTGAWYDGWETRRHNRAAFDFVVIKLGAPGTAQGVEIDTAFFTGNHAPTVSVEGTHLTSPDADATVQDASYEGWKTILPLKECSPNSRHAWSVKGTAGRLTHVRLRQFPDGGIARFRLYGRAEPELVASGGEEVEVSAAVNGGLAVAASDQHYGRASNLLLPGRGKDMGDGWETKRSRAVQHVDWAVVKLAFEANVTKIVVDTMHFRGNFPSEVQVHLAESIDEAHPKDDGWKLVVHHTKMAKDKEFEFTIPKELEDGTWRYAMLTMIPDGGVKRLRVFGRRADK